MNFWTTIVRRSTRRGHDFQLLSRSHGRMMLPMQQLDCLPGPQSHQYRLQSIPISIIMNTLWLLFVIFFFFSLFFLSIIINSVCKLVTSNWIICFIFRGIQWLRNDYWPHYKLMLHCLKIRLCDGTKITIVKWMNFVLFFFHHFGRNCSCTALLSLKNEENPIFIQNYIFQKFPANHHVSQCPKKSVSV